MRQASVNNGKSTVAGSALTRAMVGEQQTLIMTTRDAFGNKVSSGNVVFSGRLAGPVPVTPSFARMTSGKSIAFRTRIATRFIRPIKSRPILIRTSITTCRMLTTIVVRRR